METVQVPVKPFDKRPTGHLLYSQRQIENFIRPAIQIMAEEGLGTWIIEDLGIANLEAEKPHWQSVEDPHKVSLVASSMPKSWQVHNRHDVNFLPINVYGEVSRKYQNANLSDPKVMEAIKIEMRTSARSLKGNPPYDYNDE